MDGNKESKRRNTLLGGIGSSIWNLIPKFKSDPEPDLSHSFHQKQAQPRKADSCVDLDKSDNEDENSKIIYDRETNDIGYRQARINELKKERNKRVLEKNDSYPSTSFIKRAKLNVSVSAVNLPNQNEKVHVESNKQSFSYRSVCTKLENPAIRDMQRNNLSISGSIDSLADSTNGYSQGATASRLVSNIFSQSPAPVNKEYADHGYSRTSTPHLQTHRRYKTIIKRDKVSSYLTRENVTINDSLLSTPKFIAPTLADDDVNKRFDFSQLHKTPTDVNERTKKNWNCGHCGSNNPSHFNFCPYCANPNPITKIEKAPFIAKSNTDINSWFCARCSTVNNDKKLTCSCCFLGKDTPYKRPVVVTGLAQSLCRVYGDDKAIDKQIENSDILPELPVDKSASTTFKLVNSSNNAPEHSKWQCPSCWVDNLCDVDECVCCHYKNTQVNKSSINKSSHKDTKSIWNDTEKEPELKFMFGSSENQKSSIIFDGSAQNKTTKDIKFGSTKISTNDGPITFGTKDNKWRCDTCLVENSHNSDQCVSCSAKNSSIKTKDLTNIFGLGKNIEKPILSEAKFGNNEENSIFGKSKNYWNCPTCLAQNKDELPECACCRTKNPSCSKITPEHGGSIIFGTPTSLKWQCQVCLVENNAENDQCVCCNTKNPTISNRDAKTSGRSNIFAKDGSKPFGGFGENVIKFGNAEETSVIGNGGEDKWQCDACLVENKIESEQCVCCYTNKPGSVGQDKAVVAKSIFGSGASLFGEKKSEIKFGSIENKSSAIVFGSSAPSAKWQCKTCLTENKADCSCCSTTNTTSLTQDTLSASTNMFDQGKSIRFGAIPVTDIKFGAPGGKITFGTNNAAFGGETIVEKVAENQFTPTFGSTINSVAMAFKSGDVKAVDKWQCTTCMVENDAHVVTCPCCCTSKTGNEKLSNFVFNQSISVPALSANQMSNGVDKVVVAAPFIFGTVTKADSIDFSFRQADTMPHASKIDIAADIEFAFSTAATV